ncbi:MAG: Bifunctional ribokinase/ribose-5-phosphate isomerase A [Bacteroidia bacterium]|nr:Bifunctional ribokinase/ribose-5-phosphate isomerase A [Bacteroidia bacterium]
MNKVIVAGSINMDIVAITKKHPQIGETVFGTDLKYFPGGKGANQAVSSSKLGGKTTMVGMVGSDGFGKELIKFLEDQGMKNQIGISSKNPTGTALITVSTETSNNTIVVVPGANFRLTEKEIEKTEISKGDILVSQFEIPTDTIQAFFKKGKKSGTINILNPAPAKKVSKDLLQLVDILILNETELEVLSEKKVDANDEASISNAVHKIKSGEQSIIVTLGERGAVGFIKDTIVKIEGKKVKAIDTTGAGDCFVGAIAAKLSKNASLTDAIEFANVAASICVTRQGAGPSMPTLKEVISIYQPV